MLDVPVATISYSSVGKFLSCPRAWYLGEYLKLTKVNQPVDGPLPFGSRIHTPLEMWGKGLIDKPVDAWNTLMEADYNRANALGWDTATLDKEAKMGHAMLTNLPQFLDESGFFAKYKIIAVEKKMRESLLLPLPDGRAVDIVYQGKSDLIAENVLTGNYSVLDWKTSASVADSVLTVLSKSGQFPGYTRLAKLEYPGQSFEGALAIILRKVGQTAAAKPPFYAYLPISLPAAHLKHYERRLRTIAMQMLYAVDKLNSGWHPDDVVTFVPSQMSCKGCIFRNPCDLMPTYPQGASDMLKYEYVEHDPFARYAETGQIDESMLS